MFLLEWRLQENYWFPYFKTQPPQDVQKSFTSPYVSQVFLDRKKKV
jgi:hypothetical protein